MINANKLWNINAFKTASGETTTYHSKYCRLLDTGAHVNVTDTPPVDSLLWWGKSSIIAEVQLEKDYTESEFDTIFNPSS